MKEIYLLYKSGNLSLNTSNLNFIKKIPLLSKGESVANFYNPNAIHFSTAYKPTFDFEKIFGIECGVPFLTELYRFEDASELIQFFEQLGVTQYYDQNRHNIICQNIPTADGGKMIFVGTKKQAIEPVQEAAQKSGQYYVTKRWLGGTLTNFETIKTSIDRLKKIDHMREKGELEFFTKKERIGMEKEYVKLSDYLNGIRDMKDTPKALFVVDLVKEHIAVAEAKRLGIPVIGIADTNSNPEVIEYPIPGNDDAIRSIKLFSNLIAEAYLEGAAEYESKLRTQTDKASDLKAEDKDATVEKRKARPGAKKERDEKPAVAAGPQVVKVQKQRKLVAAGLAEKIEIEAELESTDATSTIDSADSAE